MNNLIDNIAIKEVNDMDNNDINNNLKENTIILKNNVNKIIKKIYIKDDLYG